MKERMEELRYLLKVIGEMPEAKREAELGKDFLTAWNTLFPMAYTLYIFAP